MGNNGVRKFNRVRQKQKKFEIYIKHKMWSQDQILIFKEIC